MTLLGLIVLLVILGVVAWLVQKAPMIGPEFKTFIVYVLLVVGAIAVIFFVIHILGGNTGNVLNLRLK